MGVRPTAGMPIKFVGEFDEGSLMSLEPGELALIAYRGSLRQDWWYRCPCGNGGLLNGHVVHSIDPIDITPSIICPGGCHYYIKDGVIA